MFRRFARKTFGNTDFEQIKGVLAHADCQNILEHRGTQRVAQRNTEKDCQNDWRNHKEHKGRGVALPPQRTENRERRTERPCGATGETAVQSVDSRKSLASTPLIL